MIKEFKFRISSAVISFLLFISISIFIFTLNLKMREFFVANLEVLFWGSLITMAILSIFIGFKKVCKKVKDKLPS